MNRIGQLRRVVASVLALAATGLALLSMTGSAVAQEGRFHQWRTTTGCLYFVYFSDPLGYAGATSQWSGSCTPGQVINGQGTMESKSHPNASPSRLTGRMVNGYWHGRVDISLEQSSGWVQRANEYDMGCVVKQADGTPPRYSRCVPAVVAGSNAAAAAPPPAARAPAAPAPSAPAPAAPAARDTMTDEVKALLARAENGDLQAQLDLGHRYAEGRGVPRNDAEALRWYRRAADQGYASAQIALGHMHNNGLGVPRNPAEAARWWCLAADQGYHEAYFRLALLHENGRGVPQDDAEAMRLYEQALLASRSGHQGTLDGLRRVEARLQQAALAKAEPAPPRNHDTSPAGDAPIRGADQTWIDPDTGAPCVTLSAQDHEDSQFWRTYNLVLTNRCNLAFRIRAGVLRWDSNPLFQEQQRVIYRRQPGGEPTELRLSCMEARRPARSYEVGCRGFSGWSVTGVAEGW